MSISNKLVNDWVPETQSLLTKLREAGCTFVKTNNGEDEMTVKPETTDAQIIEQLTACDEAHLFIRTPDSGSKVRWLFLVYGNCPGELVCDHIVDPVIDKVTDAHYEEWSQKAQPKKVKETPKYD